MTIADREPIGPPPLATPTDHSTLFYFTEINNAAGKTLLHRWFYQDELAAEVKLLIGGDRWRTWSRKRLGIRRKNSWRVDVQTLDGCLLSSQTLGPALSLPVLNQARELIQQEDLVGARLLVKNEMANYVPYRSTLEKFLDEELAIAQVAQHVDSAQLYIADARLSQLEQQKNLSAHSVARLPVLREQLEQSRQRINESTTLRLAALERVQYRSLAGGKCPTNEAAIRQRLSVLPTSNELLINSWSQSADGIEVILLDQRTGHMHPLMIGCLSATRLTRR